MESFLGNVKFYISGQKPWTIIYSQGEGFWLKLWLFFAVLLLLDIHFFA